MFYVTCLCYNKTYHLTWISATRTKSTYVLSTNCMFAENNARELVYLPIGKRLESKVDTVRNVWHDMNPERIKPEDFVAVVEISKGSKKKYELDKETGMIILDRILYTSTHYPENYGFIPRTYGDDRDPLDVLIICSEILEPLSLVRCYPIGVMNMIDNGMRDEKIIAIPFSEPNFNIYKNINELPQHLFNEMRHFFSVYKELENKDTAVDEFGGPEEAKEIIQYCIENYNKKFK